MLQEAQELIGRLDPRLGGTGMGGRVAWSGKASALVSVLRLREIEEGLVMSSLPKFEETVHSSQISSFGN